MERTCRRILDAWLLYPHPVITMNAATDNLPTDNTLRFAPGARVHQKRNTHIYGYVREIRPHAAKGTSYAIWWSNTRSVGDGWCDHDLA